jgi:hypothetical protein
MKKLVNYTPGLRGVSMKDGSVTWIKPGETVSVDADEIAAMPDLGDKPKVERDADDEALADLKAENEALRAQVADQGKQIEALKKPAK